MNEFYAPYIERENAYYRTLQAGKPSGGNLGSQALNEAVDWLCQGSRSILDFGCGSGGMLVCCWFRGVRKLTGIDLASEGIACASRYAAFLPEAECDFQCGSIDKLTAFSDECFDGLILSNILDNLRPEDAVTALREAARTLKRGGKALVKLNPVITPEQIKAWNMRLIGEDLLDDGLLLWNRDDAHWRQLLSGYFSDIQQRDVYFEEADMHNRLFLCVK